MRLNKLFLLAAIFTNGLFAVEQKVSVPVQVAVDPYLTLILDSRAVDIPEPGKSLTITAGSLYFGAMNIELLKAFRDVKKVFYDTPNYYYGTDYRTETVVQVINNSKPFELKINLIPEEGSLSVLELKTLAKKAEMPTNALYVKLGAIKDKTKFPKNFCYPNDWISFPATAEMILYRSHDEVVSDIFLVSFAILNLSPSTQAGKYGGKILWKVYPTM